MSMRRGLRLIALAVAALTLAGCTGLPTSGPPNAGLAVGDEIDDRVTTPRAEGPRPGADPEQIVAGFLEAGKTPANSWEIAREFLTSDYAARWKPEAGVSIDASVVDRQFHSSLDGLENVGGEADGDAEDEAEAEKNATSAEVRVELEQVASLGPDGAYRAEVAPAKPVYQLVRDSAGEWRIAKGYNGITLDTGTFERVYEKHALQYFDRNWSHLVSDMRWFPRRRGIATTISRELISGAPSPWLAPAVRSAFPADVSLVGDSVTVDDEQVATVPLTRTALDLSSTELSRMRTSLEMSLTGAGVSDVRLVVDGIPLSAQSLPMEEAIVDPGVIVLTADGFGTTTSSGKVDPVTSMSAEIGKIAEPIRSIDLSLDASLAAVQLSDGGVWSVREGHRNQVDAKRRDLIAPTLDPFGYIWTVPANRPHELQAWNAEVESFDVAAAWPEAETISHMRVAADGAKAAAVVTSGGQQYLVVSAVIRGTGQAPAELSETHRVARLDRPAQDIAWVGSDSIAVLSTSPDPLLTTYLVGGPSTTTTAPAGAVSVSGARTVTGLRVLSSDGAMSALRGTFWQESTTGVLVLATRAGY